jgi:hypothetical protein
MRSEGIPEAGPVVGDGVPVGGPGFMRGLVVCCR